MPTANVFLEKRISPRFSAKIPVKYRLVKDVSGIQAILQKRNQAQNAETLDISLGGMYIVAHETLNIGDVLHIDFLLPSNPKHLSASAEVVWSNLAGGGLHFLEMKNEDLNTLKTFLDNLPLTR